MNADDLRSVRAFVATGEELGVLEAQGAWGIVPHNLKLRREILKQSGKRRRHIAAIDPNPIEAYVQQKLKQARKTRKAATEFAHVTQLLTSAPTVRRPVGPKRRIDAETATMIAAPTPGTQPATEIDLAPRLSVRPRKLSIGTGQVF
ncbi:hypothetical protein CBA19CS91_26400 [Paraburkholderia hospita]|nr:hypothetical protein CBA19CS91_26400 [Paraburkholderia hospita]